MIHIDPIDQMLGEDQALASQAQPGQAVDSTQTETVEQQSPEEIEFNNLSGSTQDRIRALARKARQAEEDLQRLRTMQSSFVPPAPGSQFANPDEKAAIDTLASKGIATDEKVDRKLDERLNVLRWDMEQQRLETKYAGSKGEPQYVREEVESFIQAHPQYRSYAPEDVFRDHMFRDEFQNLELQRRGTKTGRSQTLKPTSRTSSQQEGLTPEYIAERTDINKYPDAVQWQEDHREEIDRVLQQMR